MHSSTKFQAPTIAVYFFLSSCDKVNYKQEVCFLLYLLGQIVTRQNKTNSLELF